MAARERITLRVGLGDLRNELLPTADEARGPWSLLQVDATSLRVLTATATTPVPGVAESGYIFGNPETLPIGVLDAGSVKIAGSSDVDRNGTPDWWVFGRRQSDGVAEVRPVLRSPTSRAWSVGEPLAIEPTVLRDRESVLAVGDLDEDGLPDLVTSYESAGELDPTAVRTHAVLLRR